MKKIILFLVAIIVGVLFIYFLEERDKINSEKSTTSAGRDIHVIENIGWQTYKDNRLLFEIRYPDFLKLVVGDNNHVRITDQEDGIPYEGIPYRLSVYIYDNLNKLSPKDWYSEFYKKEFDKSGEKDLPFTLRDVSHGEEKSFNDHDAFYITQRGGDSVSQEIYINRGVKIFKIFYSVYPGVNNPKEKEQQAVYNNILSSFKFINENSTKATGSYLYFMNKNSLPMGFEKYAFGKICFEPAQKETINNGNIFCFRNTDEALSALGVDKENLDLSCERYWNGADIKISNLISSNKFPISKDDRCFLDNSCKYNEADFVEVVEFFKDSSTPKCKV